MFEIGNTLREARLRRGLDVLECEAETKIRAKYLRAMEEEKFDLMPSPTYVRGFLRAYAEFLDLDGQLVLDEYESRFETYDTSEDRPRPQRAAGPPPRGASRSRRPAPTSPRGIRPPRRRRTELHLLWLAIGGVMGVALIVWLGVGETGSPTPVAPSATPSATAPEPAPLVGDPDTSAVEKPVRTKPISIVLTGTGDNGCWVQVRGRDGKGPLAYEGTIDPGEAQVFKVREGIWVRAANPAGLAVTVAGKAADLDSTATGNFLITPTGAKSVG
jgi:cytoskeleton protein RodZ